MVSRYDHTEPMSKGRAAGWVVVASSLFWPRLFIVLLWIFDDEPPRRAFDSWFAPLLGFFVLPWTTLAYATMWGLSSESVSGLEWFAVGIALLVDVWTYASIRRFWSGS